MKKSRFRSKRFLLYGFFLLGVLFGIRYGASRFWNENAGTDIFMGTAIFPQMMFSALWPLLPVLFLGTSSLGYLFIPAMSLQRGFCFSAAVCAMAGRYSPSQVFMLVGVPGLFLLPAFLLGCESAAESSLRMGDYTPAETQESGSFYWMIMLLLMGAAARLYFSTLL